MCGAAAAAAVHCIIAPPISAINFVQCNTHTHTDTHRHSKMANRRNAFTFRANMLASAVLRRASAESQISCRVHVAKRTKAKSIQCQLGVASINWRHCFVVVSFHHPANILLIWHFYTAVTPYHRHTWFLGSSGCCCCRCYIAGEARNLRLSIWPMRYMSHLTQRANWLIVRIVCITSNQRLAHTIIAIFQPIASNIAIEQIRII